METRGTCEVVNGVLKLCAGLESMIQGDYVARQRNSRGLFALPILGGTKAVVLCSGEHSKLGVILNHCPFCGASIGHHLRSKDEAEEEVAADA